MIYYPEDDTFHQIYLPILKICRNISLIKYTFMLLYCVRSMQEHLAFPSFCKQATCSISPCGWLNRIILTLPRFVAPTMFVEQCAYLLIVVFLSCLLFLYGVYLKKYDEEIRTRYRTILIVPSLVFEILLTFVSYYSMIVSLFDYSTIAQQHPDYFSSAFIIFAVIVATFYAISLVIHFATLYYIVIDEDCGHSPKLANRSTSEYSIRHYNKNKASSAQNQSFSSPPSGIVPVPSIRESMYGYGSWNKGSDTQSYSQVRNTLNNTQSLAPNEDENDYLELI